MDDGMSQKFLFCAHASALAFFSSQPGFRCGVAEDLGQGAVDAAAGCACADVGWEVDGICCTPDSGASKADKMR
jgi:hypothetical protein